MFGSVLYMYTLSLLGLIFFQGVCEDVPPSTQFVDLEKLVACIITPYLGFKGVYEGGPDPVIKSNRTLSIKRVKSKRQKGMSIMLVLNNIVKLFVTQNG